MRLKVKPSPKNFGKVKVGTVKRATLTLINPARKGPPITFANPMAVFPPADPQNSNRLAHLSLATAAEQKCKLTLQFAPTSKGPRSSTVTIFDNAGNANQVIPLSGKGE